MQIRNEAFWNLTVSRLVNSCQCFGGACDFHLHGLEVQERPGILNSEDGGNSFDQEVETYLPRYMASYPTTQS
jgi:hypothetical protein